MLGLVCLDINLACVESTGEVELGGDALDTVSGVDVLDKSDLVASCSTLAGGDGGRGKEVFPDL